METARRLVLEPGDIAVSLREEAQHSSMIIAANYR
jgi:hypothetical protein